MTTHISCSPGELTDSELITRIHDLAHDERAATAQLVAHLAEFDSRRLHHGEGCSSIFTYCTEVLHFSEHAAYNRIAAARASRRFPTILDRLADGSVHLTAVTLLAPHFTKENCTLLLEEARHRTKAQILEIIARLKPMPVVPPTMRKLPTRSVDGSTPAEDTPTQRAEVLPLFLISAAPPAPARTSAVVPLAPAQYKIQFTASEEMRARLLEAQALLRHRIPGGDPAEVLDLALKVLIKEIKKRKAGEVDRPRAPKSESPPAAALSRPGSSESEHSAGEAGRASRLIPSSVRRAVWRRDGAQCAFRSPGGRRCAEKGFLEFHHSKPHAAGGPATVENIELRCRGHNSYESELFFGRAWSSLADEREMNSIVSRYG